MRRTGPARREAWGFPLNKGVIVEGYYPPGEGPPVWRDQEAPYFQFSICDQLCLCSGHTPSDLYTPGGAAIVVLVELRPTIVQS